MEQQIIFAWAIIFCLATIAPVYGQYYSKTVSPPALKEKITQLHFFLYDILSGENPTAVRIALPPNTTDDSVAPFGSLFAINDVLREGPETTSAIIGNAQGLYVATIPDPAVFTSVMYADFAFTTGRFNGSSFSLFSRDPSEAVTELSIVGGRGLFRLARGFARVRTTFANFTTGDAITEFNVTLYHY